MDKAFLVIGKVTEALLDGDAAVVARELLQAGRRSPDGEPWHAFLVAANNLVRARNRLTTRESVDGFFAALEKLAALDGLPDLVEPLRQARPRAEAHRARLLSAPASLPALDPLIPAIVRAVDHWGAAGQPVEIVHDQQITLSATLIGRLKASVGDRLSGVTLVDSRTDARVQVADVLAGAARKIASDELNGQGDAELTALLRPYADPRSIWGDRRSWALLSEEET